MPNIRATPLIRVPEPLRLRARGIELVQLRARRPFSKQHVALEPPGKHLGKLVVSMRARRHCKNIVQLFEGALFGLGEKEIDENEGDDVEAGVEAKGALRFKGEKHAREGEREHGGPEVVGGHGPGHADFAVGDGEDLGGVGKGHGAFAGGVEGVEEVDEEGDHAEMGAAGFGYVVTHAGREQGPEHLGKSED